MSNNMNPELEFAPNELYIRDESTGNFVSMGVIYGGTLEVEMVEPEENKVLPDFTSPIRLMSDMAFETTMSLSEVALAFLLQPTNNWLRNHGFPPIRKSKRRIRYGQWYD